VKQTLAQLQKYGFIDVKERLPRVNKRVRVITTEFRCEGALQFNGSWRQAGSTKELHDVIAWAPLNPTLGTEEKRTETTDPP